MSLGFFLNLTPVCSVIFLSAKMRLMNRLKQSPSRSIFFAYIVYLRSLYVRSVGTCMYNLLTPLAHAVAHMNNPTFPGQKNILLKNDEHMLSVCNVHITFQTVHF